MPALRVLWRGIMVFERYGTTFIVANLFAAICCIPIVTIPAAIAGLTHLAYIAHTSPTTHTDDYWQGFRLHFRQGIVMAVLNAIVIGVLWVNFTTYQAQTGIVFVSMRFVWVAALVGWLAIQLYFWPILERMEKPDIRLGLYNAGLMVLKNPSFTVIVLIGTLIVLAISAATVVPLALITLSIIASISVGAVQDRLSV